MSVQTKTQLNTTIDTDITTNGSNDITGAELNSILSNMVDSYEDFVPSYTTAQIAALTGMTLRQRVFNTTDNDYEWYDGTRWVKEAHPKYKVYTALLTQTSTNAPTAVILENNLGTISFSYVGVGQYYIQSTGLFTSGKTWFSIACGDGVSELHGIEWSSANTLNLVAGGGFDDTLINTPIEIRVYYA